MYVISVVFICLIKCGPLFGPVNYYFRKCPNLGFGFCYLGLVSPQEKYHSEFSSSFFHSVAELENSWKELFILNSFDC